MPASRPGPARGASGAPTPPPAGNSRGRPSGGRSGRCARVWWWRRCGVWRGGRPARADDAQARERAPTPPHPSPPHLHRVQHLGKGIALALGVCLPHQQLLHRRQRLPVVELGAVLPPQQRQRRGRAPAAAPRQGWRGGVGLAAQPSAGQGVLVKEHLLLQRVKRHGLLPGGRVCGVWVCVCMWGGGSHRWLNHARMLLAAAPRVQRCRCPPPPLFNSATRLNRA